MATRGRWPRLVIEFMDGQTREFQFSPDDYPAGWETTDTDLIVVSADDTTRRVFPRCNIRCFIVHKADPEADAIDAAIRGNTEHALDWSDAVDAFRATTRREDFS